MADAPPPPQTCPWCPYTGSLKQVLMHMEAAHQWRWCDLVLYPPIAGGIYECATAPSSEEEVH
jgi:hypothetical protein